MRSIEEIKAELRKAYANLLDDRRRDLQCELLAVLVNTIGYDRFFEICQAERDGRCVVLPVRIVFEPTWDAGEKCDLACPESMDEDECCSLCPKGELFIYERPCRQEHIERIGKTVFVTREEAEVALKGKK